MKTVFVGNHANQWLMQGATHFAYENIPDFEPMFCYTPADVHKWCETLGKFLSTLDDEYILLMLDDYWVQEVDQWLFSRAQLGVEEGAAKVDLSGDRVKFPHTLRPDGFVESAANAPYRTSLQAALWRVDYLMRYCCDGWSPWDFELQGRNMARDDGALILGTSRPALRYINVMRRGQWHGQCDF
jgi:hypothetical protein